MTLYRILKKGDKYPGKHNNSTQRTSDNLKPLQPKAQMLIIWKSLIEYVNEHVRDGKSVYIKKFGCFTFKVDTELPKIHRGRNISPAVDIFTQRAQRKNIHHLKPVFVIDKDLEKQLKK